MSDAQVQEVLHSLPVNRMTELDGASICLELFSDGAVLMAELEGTTSPLALQALLERGFSWALLFEAGIAVDATGNRLVLTQWLPKVRSWPEAEQALEQILNQLDLCRSVIGVTTTATSEPSKAYSRPKEEMRLRALLSR